eukprot:scaffold74632_cov33-Tisochrysis_lutea.AAC.1
MARSTRAAWTIASGWETLPPSTSSSFIPLHTWRTAAHPRSVRTRRTGGRTEAFFQRSFEASLVREWGWRVEEYMRKPISPHVSRMKRRGSRRIWAVRGSAARGLKGFMRERASE